MKGATRFSKKIGARRVVIALTRRERDILRGLLEEARSQAEWDWEAVKGSHHWTIPRDTTEEEVEEVLYKAEEAL